MTMTGNLIPLQLKQFFFLQSNTDFIEFHVHCLLVQQGMRTAVTSKRQENYDSTVFGFKNN